jgi:hypothetical protein
MLSGETLRACETTGTAVFRIVVSSDSMKNATATSHGRSCLIEAEVGLEEAGIGCILTRPFQNPHPVRFAQELLIEIVFVGSG